MFQDALQSLLDWLSAVEPSLSTETAVMGDSETVQILIDNHKVRDATWISSILEPNQNLLRKFPKHKTFTRGF